MSPDQTTLFPVLNQGLFSSNFLETKFLDCSVWQGNPERLQRVAKAKEEIRSAYELAKRAGVFEAKDEAKTEDKFIRPVFLALGWVYDPQPRHKRRRRKVRPDYALFSSHADYESAARTPDEPKAYYSRAQVIGEAKYWGRPLNDTVKDDPLDASDATAQLVRYLDEVYFHTDGTVLWGILTNGKSWRLFSHRAASRSTNYYEADLQALLQADDPVPFRRFYGFFAKEALTPDPTTGKRWVDLYLEESDRAARAISDHLKDLIFEHVFRRVAEGFITYRRAEKNVAQETEETLREVFAGTMTLLFRLLFLLYAESRDLLPIHNELGYRRKSLQALKERIWNDLRIGVTQSNQSFEYWEHLARLFRIVDKGDAALSVPHYNGGLFHAPRSTKGTVPHVEVGAQFLSTYRLADCYVADAIKAMTFDPEDPTERRFIDYSALGVRHLGDVYEGLLEFRLRQDRPDQPVVLEHTSQERKESGSYFTPHFVVEFIVAQTIGPVLDLRLQHVEALLESWRKASERRRRVQGTSAIKAAQSEMDALSRAIFHALFGLKILDPTMGSGHFLVHTVDYLSDKIVAFLAKHPGNPVITAIERMRQAILNDLKKQGIEAQEISRITGRLTEINLIKRMVMKRCVYGVDLNPMAVELAKLSLWLDSFTLGAPLSFLDHHLKCGNTLIGTEVEAVEKSLEGGLFGTQFAGMLQATELMREVGELTDATVAEVEESESKFGHAQEVLAPFIHMMDFWQSEPFGHTGARRALKHIGGSGGVIAHAGKRSVTKNLDEAASKTAKMYRFFHWELEFPEVWYGGGRRLDEPGFDAVIGNPPWVRQETLTGFKKVLESAYPSVYHGVADIYVYVLARGLSVLKPGGRLGFIVPNKWLRANYGEPLRTALTKDYRPQLLVDFGHAPIFPDADTFPVVAIIRRPHLMDKTEAATLRVCPVSREVLDDIKLAPFVEKHAFGVPTLLLKPEGWTLEPPELLRLFEKIKQSGRPLKEFVGDVPYRGVVTGLNEAFFIDQATRDRLIAEDPKCESLIKKLLRGRNIQRWAAEWDKEWIIFAHHGFNIDQYPSLKTHLLKFKVALEPRPNDWNSKTNGEWPGRKPGIYKWYELQDPVEYHRKFEKPKIIYQEIQTYSSFAFDADGYYPNNKAFVIPTDNLYLLALLNSPMMWWFLSRYLPHMINETLSPVGFLMESFPVVEPSKKVRSKIESAAESLIQKAKSLTDMRAAFNQWVTHETGIPKLPASLETPWRLNPEVFLTVLKKAGLKRATPAQLQNLSQTFEQETAKFRENRVQALRLERELDKLILEVYRLSPEEIALLRQTAPPRSPLAVLEEQFAR